MHLRPLSTATLALAPLLLACGCEGVMDPQGPPPYASEDPGGMEPSASDDEAWTRTAGVESPSASEEPARDAAGHAGSPAESEAGTPVVASAPASDPASNLDGWTTFRHPLGAEFRHPPEWRVQETAMGLVLTPPDADPDRELIAAFASAAQGVGDPKDARVGQTLDAMMVQTFPALRRAGRPKSAATRAGDGAAYDYRGSAPDGTPVRCRVFVAISGDAAVSFSVVGDRASFERRVPVVERIFSSLEDGRGKARPKPAAGEVAADIDPQLVGMFTGEAISSGSGVYVNTQLVYALNADGTVLYGAQSHMNASQRDYDGQLRWTATGNSDGSVQRGRWSASSGFLSFVWDDGTSGRVAYGFEPDGTLVLRNAVSRKLINIYSRVR